MTTGRINQVTIQSHNCGDHTRDQTTAAPIQTELLQNEWVECLVSLSINLQLNLTDRIQTQMICIK